MKRTLIIVLAVLLGAAAIGYFMLWLSYGRQDPNHYIGNSPDECSRIQVMCIQGFERFDNAKGCGCRAVVE